MHSNIAKIKSGRADRVVDRIFAHQAHVLQVLRVWIFWVAGAIPAFVEKD